MAVKTAGTMLIDSEVKASGTNDKGPWELVVFTAEDGKKYQTFDGDLVLAIENEYMNTPINLKYEPQKKGDFWNYVIKDVSPARGNGKAASEKQTVTETEAFTPLLNQLVAINDTLTRIETLLGTEVPVDDDVEFPGGPDDAS